MQRMGGKENMAGYEPYTSYSDKVRLAREREEQRLAYEKELKNLEIEEKRLALERQKAELASARHSSPIVANTQHTRKD